MIGLTAIDWLYFTWTSSNCGGFFVCTVYITDVHSSHHQTGTAVHYVSVGRRWLCPADSVVKGIRSRAQSFRWRTGIQWDALQDDLWQTLVPAPQSWYSVPQMELLFAGGCLKIHVSETELTGLLGWGPKANHQRFHSEVAHSVCLINGSYFADLRLFISFLNLIHIWVKYVLIPS